MKRIEPLDTVIDEIFDQTTHFKFASADLDRAVEQQMQKLLDRIVNMDFQKPDNSQLLTASICSALLLKMAKDKTKHVTIEVGISNPTHRSVYDACFLAAKEYASGLFDDLDIKSRLKI